MGEYGIITGSSLAGLKENVPRLDHRVRIAWKTAEIIYQNITGNLRDAIAPSGKPDDETRVAYVARRAAERREALLKTDLDEYVLEKGLGTEAVRAAIRYRQESAPSATEANIETV